MAEARRQSSGQGVSTSFFLCINEAQLAMCPKNNQSVYFRRFLPKIQTSRDTFSSFFTDSPSFFPKSDQPTNQLTTRCDAEDRRGQGGHATDGPRGQGRPAAPFGRRQRGDQQGQGGGAAEGAEADRGGQRLIAQDA